MPYKAPWIQKYGVPPNADSEERFEALQRQRLENERLRQEVKKQATQVWEKMAPKLKDKVNPELFEEVRLWYEEVESHPNFAMRSVEDQNTRREAYIRGAAKQTGADEKELERIQKLFKPSFIRGAVHGLRKGAQLFTDLPRAAGLYDPISISPELAEKLGMEPKIDPQTGEPLPRQVPGIGAAFGRGISTPEEWLAEGPGVRPPSTLGVFAGHFVGMLPEFALAMGAGRRVVASVFKGATERVGQMPIKELLRKDAIQDIVQEGGSLFKLRGPAREVQEQLQQRILRKQRALTGAVGFSLTDLDNIARGEYGPGRMLESGLLGFAGMYPSTMVLRGLSAGFVGAALHAHDEEAAWITGIPAIDVGLTTGLMFAVMGRHGAGASSRAANRRAVGSLIRKVEVETGRPGEGIGIRRLDPQVAVKLQGQVNSEYVRTLLGNMGKTTAEIEAGLRHVRMHYWRRFFGGKVQDQHDRVVRAVLRRKIDDPKIYEEIDRWTRMVNEIQNKVFDKPVTDYISWHDIRLSSLGMQTFEKKDKVSPQLLDAILKIKTRPIQVQLEFINEIDARIKKVRHSYMKPGDKQKAIRELEAQKDAYIANRAIGEGKTFHWEDLEAWGYPKTAGPKFIGELRSMGFLDKPRLATEKARYEAIGRKRVLPEVLEEVEGLNISRQEKDNIIRKVMQYEDQFKTGPKEPAAPEGTYHLQAGVITKGPKIGVKWEERFTDTVDILTGELRDTTSVPGARVSTFRGRAVRKKGEPVEVGSKYIQAKSKELQQVMDAIEDRIRISEKKGVKRETADEALRAARALVDAYPKVKNLMPGEYLEKLDFLPKGSTVRSSTHDITKLTGAERSAAAMSENPLAVAETMLAKGVKGEYVPAKDIIRTTGGKYLTVKELRDMPNVGDSFRVGDQRMVVVSNDAGARAAIVRTENGKYTMYDLTTKPRVRKSVPRELTAEEAGDIFYGRHGLKLKVQLKKEKTAVEEMYTFWNHDQKVILDKQGLAKALYKGEPTVKHPRAVAKEDLSGIEIVPEARTYNSKRAIDAPIDSQPAIPTRKADFEAFVLKTQSAVAKQRSLDAKLPPAAMGPEPALPGGLRPDVHTKKLWETFRDRALRGRQPTPEQLEKIKQEFTRQHGLVPPEPQRLRRPASKPKGREKLEPTRRERRKRDRSTGFLGSQYIQSAFEKAAEQRFTADFANGVRLMAKDMGQEAVTWISRYIAPTKTKLARWQKISKVGFYDAWRNMETDALKTLREFQLTLYPVQHRLNRALRKTSNEDALVEFLKLEGMADRARVARSYNFSRSDLRTARDLEFIFRSTWGEDWRKWLTDYIPEYQMSGPRASSASLVEPWIKAGFSPSPTQSVSNLANNAIHTRMRLFLQPHEEAFTDLIKQMSTRAALTDSTKRQIASEIRFYVNRAKAPFNRDHETISRTVDYLNEKFNMNMKGTLPGNIRSTLLLASYAGTMPFRMGLVLRNATQPFKTTLLYTGSRNLAEGYALSFTPKGRQLAREMGFREFQGVPQEHEFPAVGLLRKGYDTGMTTYKYIDYTNRKISALTVHNAVTREAGALLEGKISLAEFNRRTGIVYFDEAVKTETLRPLYDALRPDASRTVKQRAVEATAKRAGVNMAEETQWIYRSGHSAAILNGKVGRWFGQFGTWPTNYLQFLRRGVASGDRVATERFLARWVGTNMIMEGLGQELGIEVGPWTWFGPLQYSGGPATQVAHAAYDLMQPYPWLRKRGWSSLKRSAMTFVPFYLATQDYIFKPARALSEEEAIKAVLGQREPTK